MILDLKRRFDILGQILVWAWCLDEIFEFLGFVLDIDVLTIVFKVDSKQENSLEVYVHHKLLDFLTVPQHNQFILPIGH